MLLTKYSKNLEKIMSEDNLIINNTTENVNIMLINSVFLKSPKTIFVVLSSLYEAQKYYDKFVNTIGEESVLFYPADELITAEMITTSIEFKLERINTIKSLLTNKPYIVVTHTNGIIKKQLNKEKWEKAIINLKSGDFIDRDELINSLVSNGYHRSYTIGNIGEFSVRGSIVDLFPINYIHPIRIDFFGDEIEEIKEFDINTQLSNKKLDGLEIAPLNELFYTEEEAKRILNQIDIFRKNNILSKDENIIFDSDIEKIINHTDTSLLGKYMGFFADENIILDFVDNKDIYFVDKEKIESVYEKIQYDINEYSANFGGDAIVKLDYFMDVNKILKRYPIKFFNTLINSVGTSVFARDTTNYNGDIKSFYSYLERYKYEKNIIIAFANEKRMIAFKEMLFDNNLPYTMLLDNLNHYGIYLTLDKCALGIELYKEDLIVITDSNIFSRPENKKVRYKSVYGEGARLKSVDDLAIGDYVVHLNHGIGRYVGIETMELSDVKRDYIKIMYAGNDFFYVPLEQISLVQKYAASSEIAPRLTKLGGTTWAKTKERVKNKVNDISEKLIQLYAMRQASVGFKFSEDSTLQNDFESDFMFEETVDQMKAINDVKHDMESLRPMDRLICGDVGYGKTEVAMRGAFKAVLDNKQVAYLAPTTVLVKQHYESFCKRFNRFGANVRMLSRLNSASEQEEILKGLKEGRIDIVIGTHRLLSKDVVFKDLGLLVVDEEQRFGVEHKERIKEMKVNVDSLTLSATPIPRTLQMSMLGIKDLSVIDTPPKNRYPVQTYVLERHDTVVKEAVEKELARGGQVFYLHNRVDNIEVIVNHIHELVPLAKIGFAHGQMNKNTLEERITDFVNGEFDVLVCTTIIETGIDIPNANTLIIHDASILGLSQLYQLRGRVGRSNKIAYAYLMYEHGKILTDEAIKRLQVIRDFTELGSGLKIAMRDLSIRGAGDILGSDQSGFIDSVGIDLYMRLLQDAIKEKQGIPTIEEEINTGMAYTDRHIPKNYINDDGIRIEIHKRIDKVYTIKNILQLQEELKDRFGEFSEKMNLYMYERLFYNLTKKLGIKETKKDVKQIVLVFSEKASENIDGEKLFMASLKAGDMIKLSVINKKIKATLLLDKINKHWLIVMCEFLEEISNF